MTQSFVHADGSEGEKQVLLYRMYVFWFNIRVEFCQDNAEENQLVLLMIPLQFHSITKHYDPG